MIKTETKTEPGEREPVSSTRRDWIIIPLLIVVTAIVLVVGVEFVARKAFPVSIPRNTSIIDDPVTGERAIPNSAFTIKIAESTPAEFKFNSCGQRAGMECGPKSPGVFRIVLVGSSVPFGWYVPREQTFAATLPSQLTAALGRKVEVYNDAMLWGTPHGVDLRLKGALSLKPDLILWVLTPFEIQHSEQILPDGKPGADEELVATVEPASRSTYLDSVHSSLIEKWKRFTGFLELHYRTILVLRHFLYGSETNYVKHYLMLDGSSGFLKSETDPSWQHHLQRLDFYLADVAQRASSAGVPLVVVLIPQRAQVAMISAGSWPKGIDPYKIGESVKTLVERHGGIYIDVLHDFAKVANPEQHFFPVDGHPDRQGHAMISQILARDLTAWRLSLLAAAKHSDIVEGRAK